MPKDEMEIQNIKFAKELYNTHLVSLIKTVGVKNINYKEVAKQSALVTLSYLVDIGSAHLNFGEEIKKHLNEL